MNNNDLVVELHLLVLFLRCFPAFELRNSKITSNVISGVRELFEQEPPPPPRRTRADLMRDVDADYYGYRDDDDGLLIPLEKEAEKEGKVYHQHHCLTLIPSFWDSAVNPFIFITSLFTAFIFPPKYSYYKMTLMKHCAILERNKQTN